MVHEKRGREKQHKKSLSMDSISNLKLQIRLHFIKNFIEQREYFMANGQLLLHLNKKPMPILLRSRYRYRFRIVNAPYSCGCLCLCDAFCSYFYFFFIFLHSSLYVRTYCPSLVLSFLIFICSI